MKFKFVFSYHVLSHLILLSTLFNPILFPLLYHIDLQQFLSTYWPVIKFVLNFSFLCPNMITLLRQLTWTLFLVRRLHSILNSNISRRFISHTVFSTYMRQYAYIRAPYCIWVFPLLILNTNFRLLVFNWDFSAWSKLVLNILGMLISLLFLLF